MKYAVIYYPNQNDVRYVASINDYRDGGFADPILMERQQAEELVVELNEYVEREYIGINDDENRRAHYAFEDGQWGFNVEEFETADNDANIFEHVIEDVELEKHGNGSDYLSWKIDGTEQWCQGEFFVDKDGNLHHTAIAPNGDEVEIVVKY